MPRQNCCYCRDTLGECIESANRKPALRDAPDAKVTPEDRGDGLDQDARMDHTSRFCSANTSRGSRHPADDSCVAELAVLVREPAQRADRHRHGVDPQQLEHESARRLIWRKTAVGTAAGICVEVAPLPGAIVVRDSKDPDGSRSFTAAEWTAFLDHVRSGNFDND